MEQNEMIKIHTQLGSLEERTKNLATRIDGVEKEIDAELKDIKSQIQQQAKYTADKLDNISDKLDGLTVQEEKRKASLKTMATIGGLVVVGSGFVAWIVDKWALIKETFF